MPYDTESKSRNVLASPLGEEGHEVAKGVQANWIHRGAPRPANPVRRHPAKSVCTRVRMIMILDVDVTAERRHYNTHRPLKGKRLTTFCASLALLHPLLALTHWIFRSLMLPYKSSSHSAKCVRCASLRSGGRRLAVRTAMEHPIGALPRTPFPASRDFAPVGSMSLDFQVASLSYKSSSFATSRGNEKIGGTGYCVTYDTESQSRNADFISIAP